MKFGKNSAAAWKPPDRPRIQFAPRDRQNPSYRIDSLSDRIDAGKQADHPVDGLSITSRDGLCQSIGHLIDTNRIMQLEPYELPRVHLSGRWKKRLVSLLTSRKLKTLLAN